MKRLKQLFIGLALSLLLVPLLKNNVYADALWDAKYNFGIDGDGSATLTSTPCLVDISPNPSISKIRFYVYASGHGSNSEKVVCSCGAELYSNGYYTDDDNGYNIDYTWSISAAQATAHKGHKIHGEFGFSDGGSGRVYEGYMLTYYSGSEPPEKPSSLIYDFQHTGAWDNEIRTLTTAQCDINVSPYTSVSKLSFRFSSEGHSSSTAQVICSCGQVISSSHNDYDSSGNRSHYWDWTPTDADKRGHAGHKVYGKFECGDGSRGEANGAYIYMYYSPLTSPVFTTGATLTATNLAYNGTTSKQYSVAAVGASSYTWYLDGSPNPTGASGATYTANIANLSHGNHTLKCVANGTGGASTSTNQITFNVNRTPIISSGNLM